MEKKITATKTMYKKFLLVTLVTFSSIVSLIPYIAYDYYNQFLTTYNITDGQLGWLLTAFGAAAIPGYFFGGWIADIFDAKKLVVIACISTALVGIGVAFSTSFIMLVILFFLFGITGVVLYWSAYLKVVKMLGSDDEQGRLFAVTDIAYAIFGLILQYTVIAITSYYLADNPMGFRYAYLIYGGLSIAIGIAIWFLLPNVEYKKEIEGGLKENVKLMGYAMKVPITWYLGIFTLGYFLIRSLIPYVNPYLTDVYGDSVEHAQAFTATIRSGALLIFSPIGGMLRDRMGAKSSRIITYFSLGCIGFSLLITTIPQMQKYAIWVMVVATLVLICNGMLSNFLYTLVTNAGVPLLYVGSVYGIASAIGYSSDLWLYTLCGGWLDKMGNAGYTPIWILSAVGGLMMLVMGIVITKKYGHEKPVKEEEAA